MGRPARSWCVAYVVVAMMLAAIPGAAFGAVTMTHDLNWGSNGWGEGQFSYPSDVTTDKWGNVYVAGGESGDDRVQMFTADGVFLKSVGVSEVSPPVVMPRTVATDRWGTIYVGEKGAVTNATVRMYNPLLYSESGVFQESPLDEIQGPVNLAVALDGTVYLSERGSFVQRWRRQSFMDAWSALGTATMGMGVTQDGVVLTTTDLSLGILHSVIAYDADGVYLDDWGGQGTENG
ncbi:MAG: hypothetical protein RBS17_10715 [Coriobacteriia bacterium]|nr:hypothetical protein [Coriobacteriia bacterium]